MGEYFQWTTDVIGILGLIALSFIVWGFTELQRRIKARKESS